jgi:histidinol-phosphate aminotransferase
MNFSISSFVDPAHENVNVRERVDLSDFVNLSNNEMVHTHLKSLLLKFGKEYNWSRASHYPLCINLRKKIAKMYLLDHNQVILSAGTDHAISQILAFFSLKNKSMIMQSPNYFNYERYANVNNIKIIPVPFYMLGDHEIVAAFKNKLEACSNAIVVVTSPHVYSASCLSNEVIKQIADLSLKHNHLLIIDEAYSAFSESDNFFLLRENYPNLIILRSFSKAFGVAGMRIGGVFADHNIITFLKKIGILGCINDAAISLLSFLIDHYDKVLAIRKNLNDIRDQAIMRIKLLNPQWTVLPSSTNFITFFVDNVEVADSITHFMKLHNILVKPLKGIPPFDNAIRITISDESIMNNAIDTLAMWKP